MRLGVLLVCAILLCAKESFCGNEEKQLITRILKAQGTIDDVRVVFAEKIRKTRAENPWLPQSTIDSLNAMLSDKRLGSRLGESWEGRFSLVQLRSIAQFMESPAGRAYGRQLNSLMMELSVMSGVVGMEMYAKLSLLHPDKFPKSSKDEAQIRSQLETLRKSRKK